MYAKYAKYIGIPCTYMNQVGPIPGGKEVVVQYSSDLNSNGKFYTGTIQVLHRYLINSTCADDNDNSSSGGRV